MAPLTDRERLEAYRNALSNWRFEGYVRFNLSRQAHDWIRRELLNIPVRELAQLMHEHVESGGTIDEVRETRVEWSGKHQYHYDLRFVILSKPVYFETRLICRLPYVPDEPRIEVVNVHSP
jgi:hypothetical protein